MVSLEVLWSISGSHQSIWSFPLSNVACHLGTWPYTVKSSIDQTFHWIVILLPNSTLLPTFSLYYKIRGGFPRRFSIDAAGQQRTLTTSDAWSCPISELAFALIVRSFCPELVMSPDFEYRTSIGTSILLTLLRYPIFDIGRCKFLVF